MSQDRESRKGDHAARRPRDAEASRLSAGRWIEHLEDECEENLRRDLDLLLSNSKPDRQVLQGLKKVRKMVKDSDEVLLPESGLFYENLHDKIMAAVEDVERPRKRRFKYGRKFIWPTVVGSVSMMMMLALISIMTMKPSQPILGSQSMATEAPRHNAENLGQNLAMASLPERNSLSDALIGADEQSDIVSDAAAKRLEGLSPAEADALLNSLHQ
jgi:hypothetical protein